jgi:hypothetical protein
MATQLVSLQASKPKVDSGIRNLPKFLTVQEVADFTAM